MVVARKIGVHEFCTVLSDLVVAACPVVHDADESSNRS